MNIDDKLKCFVSNHNNVKRIVSIKRPDDKYYIIDYPDTVEDHKNLSTWTKPIVEILTKMYYQELQFNTENNIRKDMRTILDKLIFEFDYKDGIVEIYDIRTYILSIYKELEMCKFFESSSTKGVIKSAIESQHNIEVKDIQFVEHKPNPRDIKVSHRELARQRMLEFLNNPDNAEQGPILTEECVADFLKHFSTIKHT